MEKLNLFLSHHSNKYIVITRGHRTIIIRVENIIIYSPKKITKYACTRALQNLKIPIPVKKICTKNVYFSQWCTHDFSTVSQPSLREGPLV